MSIVLTIILSLFFVSRSVLSSPPYSIPYVVLQNAAESGQIMPAIGLGTGAYGNNPSNCSAWPETWRDGPCAQTVITAVSTWLQMAYAGGVTSIRLDQANSYGDTITVGKAITLSTVPRENIWLLTKVGNGLAMGYADITAEFATILGNMSINYVDTVLIHWPTATAPSQEPACNSNDPNYNATFCRLESWRALVDIWKSGGARSIGVSNYNASELEEIVIAGMPLPAINQIPLNLYRSSSQLETIAWCLRHNVVVNAYSPLGVPDYHTYNTSTGMASKMLDDPILAMVTAAHPGFTPAQVVIAWLWKLGFPSNPRTLRIDHMDENLSALNGKLVLTEGEIAALNSRPQSFCDIDDWYECSPSPTLGS
jgi:diketogulonate reductase-like aldo/keto reductase